MTSTGTKVIAFELGLVIAILTWIAFDGLPWTRPQKASVIPEITDQSLGLVSSIYQPVQRRAEPVDYPADDLEVDRAQDDVDTVPIYDRGVATGGYVEPGAAIFQPRDPADSIGIFPEPVLWNDCYFPSYDTGYGYYQPTQIIVVSNSRQSARGRQAVRRSSSPRRMSAGWVNPRRPQARFAPRMQSRRVLPRASALSYGHVARQRAANVSRAGRIAPGRAAPAQRSRVVQRHRAPPRR